jgi:hypothetical protein
MTTRHRLRYNSVRRQELATTTTRRHLGFNLFQRCCQELHTDVLDFHDEQFF